MIQLFVKERHLRHDLKGEIKIKSGRKRRSGIKNLRRQKSLRTKKFENGERSETRYEADGSKIAS